MRIHREQPPASVLVAFAFARYPDASVIRIARPDGEYRDFDAPTPLAPALMLNFTEAYLWALLKADQNVYLTAHPDAVIG